MKLLYLSHSRYGGWVTFTTHLYHGLVGKQPLGNRQLAPSDDHEVIRQTTRTEKTYRDMGNHVPYRNMIEEDILELDGPLLITAVDKHHRELAMALLQDGAFIVIHDPTELRNPEFRKRIAPSQVIVIRRSMLEHMPEATFIPHPYMAVGTLDALNIKEWEARHRHAVSISRLDFDKNSHWLFEANRQLPPDRQIYIRGAENRMYTKTKILPNYPEYVQDSERAKEDRTIYDLDFRGAVNLCKTARFMTDFSVIQGDGGGTQYTFLEAIDAGTICLLHQKWIREHDSMIDEGPDQNCMSFDHWEQLTKFLQGQMPGTTATFLRTNAVKLLQQHDAVAVARTYVSLLGSTRVSVKRSKPRHGKGRRQAATKGGLLKRQPSPYCIQLELTEGCNLACSFCGIAAIRDNGANGPEEIRGKNSQPYKFLHLEAAEIIAQAIATAREEDGWNPRIELAMHGEPTLHPEYKQIVQLLRKHLPRTHLQMTTNGGGLLKGGLNQNIDDLMDAGLNVLLLDNYEGIQICDKVREQYTGPHPLFEYPADKKANPHRRRKPTEHEIVVTQDITAASQGTHATVNNHAGAAFPKNERAAGRRCAKVFREMSIRWDGNIALCCNDWPGRYRCGNILKEPSLEQIWQGAPFYAARKKLYHGERDFGPCDGCDALSYRPGLIPDSNGKAKYGKPTKKDHETIERTLQRKPCTAAIPRPWE